MDLFNSLEISTSNKPHCRIIWLNIKGVECEKVVVSYPYTSCFRDMRHIYVGPILQLRHKPNRGAIRIFININLHYITADVVSFSLKQIRVWWAFSSSKRKIIWKAYIALIFNKCPKMHENECNLAGNTITLNLSGVIHCIRFILLTFLIIKTEISRKGRIIWGCCKTAHHQFPPWLM